MPKFNMDWTVQPPGPLDARSVLQRAANEIEA